MDIVSEENRSSTLEQGKSIPPLTEDTKLKSSGLAGPLFFGLFVIAWLLVCERLALPAAPFGASVWPQRLLLLLAALTILSSFLRQLSWQNILSAALLVCLGAGALYGIARLARGARISLLQTIDIRDWIIAWIVALFSARGVAALLLDRLKNSPNFGIWLLALSTPLVAFFGFASESFLANQQQTQINPSVAWRALIFWGLPGLLMQILVTPWLIKQRSAPASPGHLSFAVWLLLNLLFARENLSLGSWKSFLTIVIGNALLSAAVARRIRANRRVKPLDPLPG